MASKRSTQEKPAATARRLVEQNKWGFVSTISIHLGGFAFGNVVSFSDGAPGSSRGIPYFYLSPRDSSLTDAAQDPKTSLTVCDHALVTCGQIDPENPTWAKLTLSGKLKLVDEKSKDKDKPLAKAALDALFSKHPKMKGWHEDHGFQIYKLDIEKLFLIDWFGEAKEVPRDEYLKYVKA